MSFSAFPAQRQVVALLQRSLEQGRLGHAYLFIGSRVAELETVARVLAKTLNCLHPPRRAPGGMPLDCCDVCLPCRKIDGDLHPDVQWLRPESKSRLLTIDQVRDLGQAIHMKPTEGEYKVAVVVAADRLNIQAANAFLKTLEEPPAKSILLLLTSEPERVIETIRSRCLRLCFAGDTGGPRDAELLAWLKSFGALAAGRQDGLLGRYQLLGALLAELARLKVQVADQLTARSPLQRYDDVEADLRERWETELAAAVEAEYRQQRSDLLASIQWWLRDIWLLAQPLERRDLTYPELQPDSTRVASRISAQAAMENLGVLERTHWLLGSNVQEALALEVGLLNLKL